MPFSQALCSSASSTKVGLGLQHKLLSQGSLRQCVGRSWYCQRAVPLASFTRFLVSKVGRGRLFLFHTWCIRLSKSVLSLYFLIFVCTSINGIDRPRRWKQRIFTTSCVYRVVTLHWWQLECLDNIVPLLLKSSFGLWNKARWRRELRKPQKMCKSCWNAGYRRQKSQARNVAVLWELDKKESRDQT